MKREGTRRWLIPLRQTTFQLELKLFIDWYHEYRTLCWSSDFDVHGRTVNSARIRNFETGRLSDDRIR